MEKTISNVAVFTREIGCNKKAAPVPQIQVKTTKRQIDIQQQHGAIEKGKSLEMQLRWKEKSTKFKCTPTYTKLYSFNGTEGENEKSIEMEVYLKQQLLHYGK